MREVPGSVLWLRQDNDAATRQLRQEAAAAGIASERLVFAGHSTAIEALWAGLPMVCFSGASFASRVSASAVAAVGMPELAVSTPAAYKALALKLARDQALLASYRARLEAGRMTFPLFDITGLTRRVEAAYEKMADLSRAGLPPEAFAID
jgi:predicted O-linked N-acetylglucosamine transferase (SPINDLY family)